MESRKTTTRRPAAKVAEASTPPKVARETKAVAAPRERRQRVQSAQTGMAVLKGLARLGGRASLSGLAACVGESPAKVHRYLVSLIEEGLVAQDTATQQYLLGVEAMMIGVAAMRQADPVRMAEPALVRLRETLEVLTSFGEGGRQPGEFYGVHSIATDSKGNIYTTETYRGQRVQKFTYKGLAPVTKKDQGVVWPTRPQK